MKKYFGLLVLGLLCYSSSYSLDKDSFKEIENNCKVWMWSANYGDINCISELINIEKNCKVFMHVSNARHGDIECKVDYKFIEKNCEVWIMNWPLGEVSCRLD